MAEKIDECVPRTHRHGRSIVAHTRCTISLTKNPIPSDNLKVMIETLSTSGAENAAQVVVRQQELDHLRKKNKATTDSHKVQSRKVLSKALLVSSQEIVRLRGD